MQKRRCRACRRMFVPKVQAPGQCFSEDERSQKEQQIVGKIAHPFVHAQGIQTLDAFAMPRCRSQTRFFRSFQNVSARFQDFLGALLGKSAHNSLSCKRSSP
jgi:hypothetical protein